MLTMLTRPQKEKVGERVDSLDSQDKMTLRAHTRTRTHARALSSKIPDYPDYTGRLRREFLGGL
jgi:hypothetical protein